MEGGQNTVWQNGDKEGTGIGQDTAWRSNSAHYIVIPGTIVYTCPHLSSYSEYLGE